MQRARRAWDRWCAYWLAPGGRVATAVLRIAIATSLLWMLERYASNQDPTRPGLYYKLGVWLLYPGRPGPEVIAGLMVVAWVATALMLVGAWSRASHAVSLVATMAIAAHGVSDGPTWSHIDVPPLLASVAFLGARGGEALAVDAWWRRRQGRAPGAGHHGPVRLVQMAVVAVFATAAYAKLKAGGFTLAWAFSDSLRHHLLVRFDWIGLPRTAIAEWLLGASWRYELFAALNLVSQLAPLAAVGLVRYPKLRALLGGLFIAEVLGLGLVMDLWNLHWLPLAVVFVDWDALVAWLARRGPVATSPDPVALPGRTGRVYVAFATGFVAFYAMQAFWLNQRLRAFPFSSFPMFAQVRAKEPYDQHQTYELAGGRIEVFGARPIAPGVQAWIDLRGTYRWMWRHRDPERVRAALVALVDETNQAFPEYGIDRARLSLAVFQAPAYPAPARLDRIDLAIIGELAADGTLRTALGTLARDGRTLVTTPSSPPLAGATVQGLASLATAPVPLAAVPAAGGLVLTPPAAVIARFAAAVVVVPAGTSERWLVRDTSRH